jgi:AraC family transcriptional regulator
MPSQQDILQLLHEIRDARDNVPLDVLAARAGWSPFHFHREFRRIVGETPKQYMLRLRLERAAARLATGAEPVVSIAADAGFASHEVFTRAFRRQFGVTPSAYRRDAAVAAAGDRARHAALTGTTGPCVGLFHIHVDPQPSEATRETDKHAGSASPGQCLIARPPGGRRRLSMPMLSIERRELSPAHVLIVRARCARHELAKTMAECFGRAFPYAMQSGVPLAGRPFTRYLSVGPGLFTIESGCVVASAAPGSGEVDAATLPGGPAAVAVHGGSYDTLSETYAEMERWMEKNSLKPGSAPWESYITDPAEHPDPANWRTEIYWPLGGR